MVDDRFSRIRQMIGEDGFKRLRDARVAVIGLGAVGSYATEALARAGVGYLRLVDFDCVRPSNINRQLFALDSTVGLPKTEAARQRVIDINPECRVETMDLFIDAETASTALAAPLDLVIDAIDSFGPKVELLCRALGHRVGLISAMGAALRTDPSQVKVGPLDKVHHCPLAKRVRKELRRRGFRLDLCCVYSTEAVGDLRRSAISFDRPDDDETVRRGRKRSVLGSLPTLTGIFGLVAANTAIKWLLEGELTS
jgi:tRNA A37 threonylcarbamoyladenosine dehydratase